MTVEEDYLLKKKKKDQVYVTEISEAVKILTRGRVRLSRVTSVNRYATPERLEPFLQPGTSFSIKNHLNDHSAHLFL